MLVAFHPQISNLRDDDRDYVQEWSRAHAIISDVGAEPFSALRPESEGFDARSLRLLLGDEMEFGPSKCATSRYVRLDW